MTSEHDGKGLVQKYLVFKKEDGRWMEKESPCFVLSPAKRDQYGKASRVALVAYAETIRGVNPKLAEDLTTWVDHLVSLPELNPGPFNDEQFERIRAVWMRTGVLETDARIALEACGWDVQAAIDRILTAKSASNGG